MKPRYVKVLVNISACLILILLVSFIIVLSIKNSGLKEALNEKEDIIVDYKERIEESIQQTNEVTEIDTDTESSKSNGWYDSYQLKFAAAQSGDSDSIIKNPIDKKLDLDFEKLNKSGSYTVASASEIYKEYCLIWQNEMDVTYKEALQIVEDKYKRELRLTQENWNDYYLNYYTFIQELSSDMYDTGGYGAWILLEAYKSCFEEVRDRTLFLKEIINIITGEVKFYNN